MEKECEPEPIRLTFSPEQQRRYLENLTAVSDFIVIGHVKGRSPGVRRLTTWARINLHTSFKHLTIRANNYFEIQFTRKEGIQTTLLEKVYRMDNQNITFTSWSPYFDPEATKANEGNKDPIWAQIVGLPPFHRNQVFLRETFNSFSEILAVDDTESYRAKLSGPRLRLLDEDINKLSKKILIPRLDREGDLLYDIEYSGYHTQCNRCRSFEHTIKTCPKAIRLALERQEERQRKRNYQRGSTHNTSSSSSSSRPLPREATENQIRKTQPERTHESKLRPVRHPKVVQ